MANEMYKLSVGGVDYPIYSEGVKLIGMSSASSLTDGFYPIVFSSNIGNATSGSSSYQKLYTDTAVGTIGYNPNTNVFWADSVKTSKLMVPTTSGGTTFGVGSNGQVLKSNGTTVYWASDSNTTYSAGTGLTLDGNTKTFAAKLTSTTAATYDSVTASNVSGRQYPVVVDKSGYLSVNVPWTDANTWRGISDIYTSTDSASSDTAFSRKGANTMYTALLNGHAGTADKLVSSGTAISLGSATGPVYFKDGVPVACTTYANASVKSATSAGVAGKLSNCKTAEVTGAVTGSVSWDGSGDLSIATTLTSHTHDDRYYTESEINTKLAGKSDTDHTHDYASSSHNHDDMYYTESEMNTKLAGKSDTGHNHNGAYLKPARFNTTSQNIPYIKININSENAWMMGFNVRVYQSYSFYEIRFSGYQYGNSYWYTPAASLVDGDGEINVFFGYDAVKKLWIGISGGDYTGVEITNVTNGYNSAGKIEDLSSLFTITNVTTLGGTTQKTLTLKPAAKTSHTHDVSATTTTAATVASSTHTHTGTTGGASNTSASVAASGHTHGTDNPGGHTHSTSGTNTASGGHTHTINANASSNRVNVAAIAHTHSTSSHDGHTHSISSTATTSAGSHGHTINAAADNTTNRVTVAASAHTHGGSTNSITGTSTVTTSGHTHGTTSHDGHTHSVSGTAASAGAHTHTTSGTAASNGAHTHTTSGSVTLSCSVSTAAILTITPSFTGNATGSAGDHTHSVSGSAASNGAHTHTTSGTAASAGAHSHTANSTASDYHITVASNSHTHGLNVTATGTAGVSVATGAHTHTTVDNGGHTHNFSATTSSAGSHSHTATATSTTDYQVSVATGAHSHTAVAVDDHNHTFTGNATGSAGGHTHTVNASGTAAVSVPNGSHTHSFTSDTPSATATVAAQGHTHVTGAAK